MKTDKELCLELLYTMDVPSWRVENEDWNWLNRNLHIRNAAHPNFEQVRILLRKILKVEAKL